MRAERESASIVLLGGFNPAIFQPAWLARKDLVSSAEAEGAEVELIHRNVSAFRIANLRLQVVPERLFLEANDPPNQVVMRDMALSLLRLLHETPVSRMGLNWQLHFKFDSEDIWHRVGHALAPKSYWDGLIGDSPGLLDLKIQGHRTEPPGQINVVIRPSELFPKRGIFFEINNDYGLPADFSGESASYFEEIIRAKWEVEKPAAHDLAIKLIDRALA